VPETLQAFARLAWTAGGEAVREQHSIQCSGACPADDVDGDVLCLKEPIKKTPGERPERATTL
jgi:hypothetical protein